MNKERYETAMKMRAEKKTYREIGEYLNVSPVRAREIVLKAARIENAGPHWTDGLTVRTAYALRRAGFESREHLKSVLCNGLSSGDYKEIGKKTIAEIRQWLGIEGCETNSSTTDSEIHRAIAFLEKNGYRVEKLG